MENVIRSLKTVHLILIFNNKFVNSNKCKQLLKDFTIDFSWKPHKIVEAIEFEV